MENHAGLEIGEPLNARGRVRLHPPNPFVQLQRNQIRVCGEAANTSIAPLSAATIVKRRAIQPDTWGNAVVRRHG